MTLADDLAAFRRRHHFEAPSVPRRVFWVTLGPLRLPLPHPEQLHWHDLHHLALEYEPNLLGEIEISAFELRTGVPNARVGFLCIAGAALGLVLAPRRLFRAWRRARGVRNLYCEGLEHDRVLQWSVEALRGFMGVAPER